MSEERLTALETKLSELLQSGGASITMQDPRVSSAYRWLAGIFASVTVLVMVWVASSINRLNETMAKVATQNDAIMASLNDHSDRIKSLERLHATK